MTTKREYLVSLGLAKEGRGKFSNAAKEALVKAEKEGIQFSDSTVPVKPATKPTGEARTEPVVKTDTVNSPYLFPSDFRYPEAEYKAVEVESKKEHSMRECCNTCRVSLTNHMCDSPSVHGKPVKVVAR